jgi:hypothetical protein
LCQVWDLTQHKKAKRENTMRMIDYDRKISIKTLGIYLSPQEAEELRDELNELLENPEANEHFHVYQHDMSREISCSIITENKLKNIKRYNKLEQQILLEK